MVVTRYVHIAVVIHSLLPLGFKPTGNTVAALVDITNTIFLMLKTITYVRCLLTVVSKAFNSVYHRNQFVKVREKWSFA